MGGERIERNNLKLIQNEYKNNTNLPIEIPILAVKNNISMILIKITYQKKNSLETIVNQIKSKK